MFAFNEVSNYGGRPTYLFSFTRGSQSWHYTAADRSITIGSTTYTAAPMSMGPLSMTIVKKASPISTEASAQMSHFCLRVTKYITDPTAAMIKAKKPTHADGTWK